MKPFTLALLVSLTAAYAVLAQAPAATRAQAISGRVIDAQDSAPLRRARAIVSSGERQIETMFTDDQGRFSIVNAPVTPLTVRASKAGFATAVVAVSAGGAGSDIGFALARSAGVSGRVRDENGTPVNLAYVTGRLLLPGAGRRPDPSGRFFVQTDRLGDYRLGSLPAGRYEITAVRIPPELRGPGEPKVEEQLFGPADALDVATGAVTVTLAGGDEVRDVDFTIPGIAQTCLTGPSVRPPDGVVAASISGRVTALSGEPLVCAAVRVGPTPWYHQSSPIDRAGTSSTVCRQDRFSSRRARTAISRSVTVSARRLMPKRRSRCAKESGAGARISCCRARAL